MRFQMQSKEEGSLVLGWRVQCSGDKQTWVPVSKLGLSSALLSPSAEYNQAWSINQVAAGAASPLHPRALLLHIHPTD